MTAVLIQVLLVEINVMCYMISHNPINMFAIGFSSGIGCALIINNCIHKYL
jgi:hypothetical protein